MTRIKICGLRRKEDIECVNQLLPEYIGFVFAPKSKRYVTKEQAASLKALLNPAISVVGVFVNDTISNIEALVKENIIDIIQLHGQEDETYIKELKKACSIPVIKAFSVSTLEDIENAVNSIADYILLDNGKGGTGESFDWSLLKDVKRPYFLAGGLTPDNVRKAIGIYHPFAVDTSSGVETNQYKDHDKIQKFIDIIRNE